MAASESRRETTQGVKQLFAGETTCGWCRASTRRLLLKLAHHKPAGVARHFHLLCLVDLLNHVYDDESDIIFEDYLSEEHLNELKSRRAQPAATKKGVPVKYPPSYKIRPDAKQIEAKLDELYGMSLVDDNELIPEELFQQKDFELPAYVLAMEDYVPPSPPAPPPQSQSSTATTQSQPSQPATTTPAARKAASAVRRGAPRAAAQISTASSSATSAPTAATAATTAPSATSKKASAAAATASPSVSTKSANSADTTLFSPPVKRATRTGVKRRAADATAAASPSLSPRSSRSSTSAKRER